MNCPNCASEKTRRGGTATWLVYLALIAAALIAVLAFELNAAIVGGIVIAAIVLTHLILNQRACLDCGAQWRG